jgi:hypothetical protein
MKSFLALVVFVALTGTTSAADPDPVITGGLVKKSGPCADKKDCTKEAAARAKAALALAAASKPSQTKKTGCSCVSAPGGVDTCGSYLCPANGGKGECPCSKQQATAPAPKEKAQSETPTAPVVHAITYIQRGNTIYECGPGGVCRVVGVVVTR